jgi:hypothetical protein
MREAIKGGHQGGDQCHQGQSREVIREVISVIKGNQGRSSVRSSVSSRAIKGDINLEQGAVAERTAQVAVGYERAIKGDI